MKTFWFRKKKTNYLLDTIKGINYLYLFFLVLWYGSFWIYNQFYRLVFAEDRLNFLEKNVEDLALLIWPIDSDISKILLSANKVFIDYMNWDEVLDKDYSDINYIISWLQRKIDSLLNMGFGEYKPFLSFLDQALNFREDLFSLLGKDWPQKYLILFQNSSEKRPDWWFFWSYLLLTFDKWRIDYKIYDSYYPEFINPDWGILAPQWAEQLFPDRKIWFIASNKFGFTDMDASNIKAIYEKTFPLDKIRGVVFINSRFFEEILPGFVEKMWEWQFANACIDIIRWTNLPYKKELYIKWVNDYLTANKTTLMKNSVKNFDKLLHENNFRIYLTDVSDGLNQFIENNNLTTKYSEDNFYFWDYNNWYNKSDRFVSKLIQIEDLSWNIVKSSNNDIFDIKDLKSWDYLIKIIYNINMPQSYIDYIYWLEKKYWIKMTEREIHILWLDHVWDNRWLVYLPLNTKILWIDWDSYENQIFKTPFSQNVFYKLNSQWNNQLKYMSIKIHHER